MKVIHDESYYQDNVRLEYVWLIRYDIDRLGYPDYNAAVFNWNKYVVKYGCRY